MKNLKIFDIIYIKLIILMSIFIIVFSKNIVSNNEKNAIIKYDGNEIITLDLSINTKIILLKKKYPLLQDNMEIEIKNNKIAVIKEKSQHNYCSLLGYIKNENEIIICEPNRVMIVIENKNKDKDIDIELK